jgi:hypothetical protein
MSLSYRWERQVDHFVCHRPILLEIRQAGLAANRNGDKSNRRTKRPTIVNTSALLCTNSYRYARHRIAAKIGRDRLSGGAYPPDQIFMRDGYFLAKGKHIDAPARNLDCRGFAPFSIADKHEHGSQQCKSREPADYQQSR